MLMGKIILLNGPPSSGKDTGAKHIREFLNHTPYQGRLLHTAMDRFSLPVKRAFAGMMGVSCTADGIVTQYEPIKELPIARIGGMSYRQWQIEFSEDFMKPKFGEAIFGQLLIERINRR